MTNLPNTSTEEALSSFSTAEGARAWMMANVYWRPKALQCRQTAIRQNADGSYTFIKVNALYNMNQMGWTE